MKHEVQLPRVRWVVGSHAGGVRFWSGEGQSFSLRTHKAEKAESKDILRFFSSSRGFEAWHLTRFS